MQDVLDECQEMNSAWFDDIIKLINESNFNVNKLLLKNHADKKQCKNITLKNNKVIRKHCQLILNKKFDQEWQEEINKMERLKFYKEIKNKPLLDLYLTKLESRTHRSAITRLIISAHKLKIETGRYSSKVNRVEQTMRTCDYCSNSNNPMDDEIHFIFDCENNANLRKIYLEKVNIEFQQLPLMSKLEKIELFRNLLTKPNSNEDLKFLAKFIFDSEQKRKLHLT